MQAQTIAATPLHMRFTGHLGWLRGALGAFLGIVLVGLVSRFATGSGSALPWLIAPMGASAVLLFMLPASPLSQPWPVLGGNLVAAVIGLACLLLLGPTPLSAGLATGLAISAMSLARCLHPPAGGTALMMALSGPAMAAAGWHALLLPVALNVTLLLAFAFVYNSLTGHAYPHRAPAAPAALMSGYDRADLDAVLEEWDEVLDIDPNDLDALFRAVERRVQRRGL